MTTDEEDSFQDRMNELHEEWANTKDNKRTKPEFFYIKGAEESASAERERLIKLIDDTLANPTIDRQQKTILKLVRAEIEKG